MPTGPALLLLLAAVMSFYVGEEAWIGIKIAGHDIKRGGVAIVHVLKKIPHPHHRLTASPVSPDDLPQG